MRTILVVDDQPHILRVVKMGLERSGHNVETARNGEVAFSLLAGKSFDVLITDVDMPKMNGCQLCEKIADELSDRKMDIYIVSAKTDPKLREWVDAHSGIQFLEKPLSLRVLNEHLACGPILRPAA